MPMPGNHPVLGSEHTSKVPNAKKPKPRPPRGLRDRKFFPGRSLPTYTGPYSIGTMEIEVPVENPRVISHITRKKKHVLQLETVLMTIYYPASLESHNPPKDSRLSRQLWFGRPRYGMAQGYGDFAGLPTAVVLPLFLPALFTKLPAYRNAGIARHWAPNENFKNQGERAKTEEGEKPPGTDGPPCFPLMMFSHGLGGTRTMYSSLCGEFASYGFIVCAVEHRDGSSPRSYVNHAKSGYGSRQEREARGNLDHWHAEQAHGYDIVDYMFPQENPYDTGPNNPKGVDTELRKAQINLRMAEIEEAYQVMCKISSGDGQRIAEHNLRRKGYQGSSSYGLNGVDWKSWEGRVNLEHVTACGHSFGAATVVEMLRSRDRLKYYSQGIIYDIWGGGTLPPSEDDTYHRIRAPILAINSEAFTYWPENFHKVDAMVKEAQATPEPVPAWLLTVRGTVHISQSDFPLLYPRVCSLFLKAVASPHRALDINVNASLEFLSQVMPPSMTGFFRAFESENLLESKLSPLDRIPSSQLHRPKNKWVAARLEIRHEWIYRISPKLFRKLKRAKAQREGKSFDETGNEIWLHSKPDSELVEEHRRRMMQGAGKAEASVVDMCTPPELAGEATEGAGDTVLPMNGHTTLEPARPLDGIS
ncbi:hypothetical protein Q7P37_001095 [Cladosporium fusiforme]